MRPVHKDARHHEKQEIPTSSDPAQPEHVKDDVTRIELQAVAGIALAAIGVTCDDQLGGVPVPSNLMLHIVQYSTGVEANDTTFKSSFPYVQTPWRGTDI